MRLETNSMNLLSIVGATALLSLLAISACKDEPTTNPEPSPQPEAETSPDPVDAEAEEAAAAAEAQRIADEKKAALETQITQGKELFGANCASCHGDAGQGKGKTPKVVGEGALSLDAPKAAKSRKTVKFNTAADVAGYVVANMPPKKAGTLKPEEYYAVLAFDLSANGIALTEPVTEGNAASIQLRPPAAAEPPAETEEPAAGTQ